MTQLSWIFSRDFVFSICHFLFYNPYIRNYWWGLYFRVFILWQNFCKKIYSWRILFCSMWLMSCHYIAECDIKPRKSNIKILKLIISFTRLQTYSTRRIPWTVCYNKSELSPRHRCRQWSRSSERCRKCWSPRCGRPTCRATPTSRLRRKSTPSKSYSRMKRKGARVFTPMVMLLRVPLSVCLLLLTPLQNT